jgi:hypothetical protein
MDVHIMPWHLAYTFLGNVTLRPSDKLLKSCPSGHILECPGFASVVPLMIDKVEVTLDFHIFDILDLDLLLGSPIEKLLDASRGSLDEKLREASFAISPLFSEYSLEKPLPKQNPLEEMTYVSLFTSLEHILIEVVDFSTPQEYDSEDPLHIYEGKNYHHHPRSSLRLFPLTHIMLLSTLIENQHRSYMMNLLRWRIHGPWKYMRH